MRVFADNIQFLLTCHKYNTCVLVPIGTKRGERRGGDGIKCALKKILSWVLIKFNTSQVHNNLW